MKPGGRDGTQGLEGPAESLTFSGNVSKQDHVELDPICHKPFMWFYAM